jgi:choline kinase
MKAIILCAGQGRRLLPYTESTPKCLLKVGGKHFIEWQIDTLRAAGINEIVTVIGYAAEDIHTVLKNRYGDSVKTAFNPFFEVADNLASCWMAREHFQGDVILLNGDTLFEPAIVKSLLSENQYPITLAVDHKTNYDDDDMKVIAEDKRLLSVGKKLPLTDVNAESIGMMHFDPIGSQLFHDTVSQLMHDQTSLKLWYLSVIDQLGKDNNVGICSIHGNDWTEVDFVQDLETAQALVDKWTAN